MIIAYNSHFGGDDTDLEWYMEVEDETQIALQGHYNMAHATQDRQVGRIHGRLVHVVGHVGEDKEHRLMGEHGKEMVAVGQYMGEEDDHTPALAAQEAYNKWFAVKDGICSEILLVAVYWILDFDVAVQLKGTALCSHGPGS